jgi:hypothetical protein
MVQDLRTGKNGPLGHICDKNATNFFSERAKGWLWDRLNFLSIERLNQTCNVSVHKV